MENYVRQCSIMMTCVEMAKAGLFLAQDGRGAQGTVVSRSEAKRIGSIMLTCGMYDAAGEFAYRVGLAGKERCGRRHPCDRSRSSAPSASGARGWTPKATPLPARAALADLSDRTGWSVF